MTDIKFRIPCCKHESRDHISKTLMHALTFIESELDHELQFTSGLRCIACNAKVGGVARSEHITGEAVDILCSTSQERFTITLLALRSGSVRIGIGRRFIHVGFNINLPQEVLWLY